MTLPPGASRWFHGGPLAIAALLICSPAEAQQVASRKAGAAHVTVELIADRDHAQAGTQWLGLRFVLDPEWHIYWQNPGDSGGPPEVQWQLPTGMTTSPVEWPLPQRIEAAGEINYGYQNAVVLPVKLTIAAAAPASPAVVRAALRWLVCRDICVPGAASLALRWPLDDGDRGAVASWSQAISRARTLVPQAAPPTWRASAASGKDSFTLTLVTGQREERVSFFPIEVNQIADSAPQTATPQSGGIRLSLRKSAQLAEDPSTLRGVVSFPDGRAFEIAAPVSR